MADGQTGSTKQCKTCRMDIPAGAKKCPYCHQWQNWLSTITVHPLFVFLLVFAPIVVFYVLGHVWMNNIFPKGESFRDYADQVAVVESRIEFGQDQCGPTVGAIGTIRNSSPIGWKDIRFQVEFFDSEGNLVDAGQQSEYLSPHLPANEEIAFKVSFTRQFSEDKYMTHRIRVISAVDTRQRF